MPTPEELEVMFQQNKNNKIAISKLMLAEFLENNPIHSTAHGNKEGVYSVTEYSDAAEPPVRCGVSHLSGQA